MAWVQTSGCFDDVNREPRQTREHRIDADKFRAQNHISIKNDFMRTTTFNCPGCQQRIEAPAEIAGQTVACPTCGQSFTAPPAENLGIRSFDLNIEEVLENWEVEHDKSPVVDLRPANRRACMLDESAQRCRRPH